MRKRALPVLETSQTVDVERREYDDGVLVLFPFAAPVTIRRAKLADAPVIHALLEHWVREGKVLPRTLGQVYRMVRDFVVAEENGEIIGCAALRLYNDRLAEVSALAVHPEWHGRGVGRRMVETIVDEANALGIARLFALTLEEPFFHRLGFRTVPIAQFPEKIAQDCRACARRTACKEITVVLDMNGTESPAGRA